MVLPETVTVSDQVSVAPLPLAVQPPVGVKYCSSEPENVYVTVPPGAKPDAKLSNDAVSSTEVPKGWLPLIG